MAWRNLSAMELKPLGQEMTTILDAYRVRN